MQEITEILKAKQRESGASDSEFARVLGVPLSTWKHTRLGRRRLANTIARAAMRAFPELTPQVVSFLLSDVTVVSTDATSATKRSA